MFELSHLRAFVTVAAELHFGRAAARLNITQSPLSRQVQALEQILGVSLFVRTSRSVHLTSAGHRFLREAHRVLEQAEASLQATRRASHSDTGSIIVGLVGAATYDALPRLVRQAREMLPDVELSFCEMLTSDQVQALALRRIDFGLGRLPRGARGVETAVIARERLVLAVPDDHVLVDKPGLSLRDLGQHRFIGFEPGPSSSIYELLEHAFITEQFTPHIVQRSRQTQTILSLVSAGAGVALVPETARNASFSNIRFLNVAFESDIRIDMHSLWRPDNDNPALPAMRSIILDVFLGVQAPGPATCGKGEVVRPR